MFKLKDIPTQLQSKLVGEYIAIKRSYVLGLDSKSSQLSAGRFAEVTLRIFQHLIGNTPTSFGTEIPASEKDRILNRTMNDGAIDFHVRQKVAVLTRLLLDFRNNRDIAHLGGFDANQMDAYFTMASANWIMAELLRVYGDYPMSEAQKIVASITLKEYPVLFSINGEDFISRNDLKASEEVLVLLYKSPATANFLFRKTRDGNQSRFKKMLTKLEKEKLVAFTGEAYHLLPRGMAYVDDHDLLAFR